MSAVFFYFFGVVIPNIMGIWLDDATMHTGTGMMLVILAPGLLALISLAGCTVFLRNSRTTNRHWYLGIPLWIIIAAATVLLILSPLIRMTGLLPPSPDLGGLAGMGALFLLAPCSVIFFWSIRDYPARITIHVIIALGVSIVSAILLYGLLFPPEYAPGEHVGMSMYEPFLWLYLILGLPIVGALYIVLGLKSRYRSRDSDADGLPK